MADTFPIPTHPKFQDLTGKRFARWRVIGYAGSDSSRRTYWHCICDCGSHAKIAGTNIKSGKTKSCGCYNAELTSLRRATHRKTNTPEWVTWTGMIQRCNYSKHKSFGNYGGRGISVCERWRSFENFLADMGHRPSPEHSIDRIDNDGNYEPGNCRWTTSIIQRNNRRPRNTVVKDRPQNDIV